MDTGSYPVNHAVIYNQTKTKQIRKVKYNIVTKKNVYEEDVHFPVNVYHINDYSKQCYFLIGVNIMFWLG